VTVADRAVLATGLVHSFYVEAEDLDDVPMRTTYRRSFASAVGVGDIRGVQFHPEKRHRFGMRIPENFASLPAC
jgi:imidazole glycerol-phosphate synthase subunit HisH